MFYGKKKKYKFVDDFLSLHHPFPKSCFLVLIFSVIASYTPAETVLLTLFFTRSKLFSNLIFLILFRSFANFAVLPFYCKRFG